MLGDGFFRFLNVTNSLPDEAGWDRSDQGKLWRYNLHYFDDLTALDAGARVEAHRQLINRWVRETVPGVGTGWEPYPTSLRIVNWLKWDLSARSDCGKIFIDDVALQSLATQIRWLRQKLEKHLLGNHLWANAKALVFAGLFFEGAEASRWLADGLRILDREFVEQILPDGGHFERSPMYHATLLEDVLDLINLARTFDECLSADFVERCRVLAKRMLHWLRVMTHPDGEISFFNDAAFEISPCYPMLVSYALLLGVEIDERRLLPIEVLKDSGYVRLQNDRVVVLCDVAPVGPDYLPGHAHADSLSYELSLDGRRTVVNGGTSTYENDDERCRQRGTAAHNSVIVDGKDSSEVWGAFRVARRAVPFDMKWGQSPDRIWLSASHDGYHRLPGAVIHKRRWTLMADRLVIDDEIEGRFEEAFNWMHFNPDIHIEQLSFGNPASFRTSNDIGIDIDPCAEARIESSTWHPEFGCAVPNQAVRAGFNAQKMATLLKWK